MVRPPAPPRGWGEEIKVEEILVVSSSYSSSSSGLLVRVSTATQGAEAAAVADLKTLNCLLTSREQ